jgi:hypothetical protein
METTMETEEIAMIFSLTKMDSITWPPVPKEDVSLLNEHLKKSSPSSASSTSTTSTSKSTSTTSSSSTNFKSRKPGATYQHRPSTENVWWPERPGLTSKDPEPRGRAKRRTSNPVDSGLIREDIDDFYRQQERRRPT